MSFLFEKKNKIKETTCLLSNARDENERVVLRETNWEEEEEWDREEKKKTNRSTHYDDFNSIWVFAEKKRMNDEMALGRNEQSKTQSTRFDVSYLRYPREIDKNAHINEKKRNNYEYTQ